MHWHIEDDEDISHFVVPESVVDLQFNIECKLLPVDHAHALSLAVQQALPWFADDEVAALHLIHGADSGNGWERPEASDDVIYLSRRTKLILRLPSERLDDAMSLIGQRLDVAGNLMVVKQATTRQMSVTSSLYSRYAAAAPGEGEELFLQRTVSELKGMGITVKKILCGKEHRLNTPEGDLVTRSLLVAELTFGDAITLQQRGVGAKSHKKLGCGLFIAHKTV